jgi:glycosyltransferase involved in cell wall biosynthesis
MILVTFALFTYNQEEFVAEALQGIFDQTYSNIEILIVDDCSKDKTIDVINQAIEKYTGAHSIVLHKNHKNVGVAEQVNKVNLLANGDLIVAAAGDDVSLPTRVSKLVACYVQNRSECNYYSSNALELNLSNKLPKLILSPGAKNIDRKWLAAISSYPVSIGATQAWTKQLTTAFPKLNNRILTEDQVLGFRSQLLGTAACIDEPLVLYRVGSGVSTQKNNTFAKYYSAKIAHLFVLQQRSKDAAYVGQYSLALFIAIFTLARAIFLPLSPIEKLISLIKLKFVEFTPKR